MDLNWPVKQARLWFLKVLILLKMISGEVKTEKKPNSKQSSAASSRFLSKKCDYLQTIEYLSFLSKDAESIWVHNN